MSFKKIVEHCVKHKFLNPNFCQFSLLGDALQRRVEQEWLNSSVIQNNNCLYISSESITQLNLKLVDLFCQARTLMGSDSSISLASLAFIKKIQSVDDVKSVSDLMEALPQTHLNLCTLVHPSHKIDEFTRLQKARLRWWKSYLQQPVLLNTTSVPVDVEKSPFLEQRIEFSSTALGSEPFEVIEIYKPESFESLQLDDDVKKSLIVKFQRKSSWPVFITCQMKLELAVWFFLTDAFYVRNKTSVLSLHKSLAPFAVGIVVEGTPTRATELEDLRRLMSLDFKLSRIPVLPLSAPWTTAQCDARGVPYLICLSDSTLEQGVCGLRSRDTTLQEQVHVGDVVGRLKSFLIR